MSQNSISTKRLSILFWIFLSTSFLFLRLYKLPEVLNFSSDQGSSLLEAHKLWNNKQIVLTGPPTSISVFGRHLYYGPITYYIFIFIMLLTNWNPLLGSKILIFLSFLGMIFLYKSVKILVETKPAYFAIILYTFLPTAIDYSKFFWNPNLLLIFTPIFTFFVAKYVKTRAFIWMLFVGITSGVCLQLHFQFLTIIFITLAVLFTQIKQGGLKTVAIYLSGLILGYSPILIFELRNSLFNIETAFLWLKHGSDNRTQFQTHYILVFIPLFSILAGWILNKLWKQKKVFVIFFLIIFITYSAIYVFRKNEAFGMPKSWNYVMLEKSSKIIAAQNPINYNIVNLLSGDTRFYSLRYLLTIAHNPPMAVEEYPQAQELFIISYENEQKTLNNPVWEMHSFADSQAKQSWRLSQNVYLYHLEKNLK
jgi:hypothetical protein